MFYARAAAVRRRPYLATRPSVDSVGRGPDRPPAVRLLHRRLYGGGSSVVAVAAVRRGDSTTGESGESSPAERAAAPRLGALFRLEARSAGHGADWRAYAAGRLLLPGRAAAPV